MKGISELREAAARTPVRASAVHELGIALGMRGEVAEAVAQFRRAVDLEPHSAVYHRMLGWALGRAAGHEEEATAHLERALALAPEWPEAYEGLLWQYMLTGREAEVPPLCLRALAAFPNRLRLCVDLWRAHLAGGGGEELFPSVAAMFPADTRRELVPHGFVRALMSLGRYRDAYAWIVREWSPDPIDAGDLALLAHVETALGDYDAARRHYEQVLAVTRHGGVIRSHLMLMARCGDYALVRPAIRSTTAFSAVGSPPSARLWEPAVVRGRTVMLRNAGGAGDNVHFARAASLLRAHGARVIVECQSTLRRLMQTVPGVDAVVAPHDDEYPPFDFECNLSSVLLMLDWEWRDMEAQVPYLHVPIPEQRRWRTRVARRAPQDGCLHVGIEWRTQPERVGRGDAYTCRSARLDEFEPLTSIPGVVCHALHVGDDGAREMQTHGAVLGISPLADEIGDFMDTAAALSAVDVVVTVDTGTAHVAGALGRPTLLLLAYYPCWRWGTEAAPSRWYPTCLMFRQQSPGDWSSPIAAAAHVVRAIVAERRAGANCAPVQLPASP